MRKISITLLAFVSLFIPGIAFGADDQFTFQPIVSVPLPTSGSVDGTTSLSCYINAAFKIAITVSVVLAVIMIIIDGFKYMTSEAVGNKKDALGGIRSALFGLILLLASWLILNIINPQILSLSVLSFNGSGVSSCGFTAASGGSTATPTAPSANVPNPLDNPPQSTFGQAPQSSNSASTEWCYKIQSTAGSGKNCYPDQASCVKDQQSSQPAGWAVTSACTESSSPASTANKTGKQGSTASPGASGSSCNTDSECGPRLLCSTNNICAQSGHTTGTKTISTVNGREFINFAVFVSLAAGRHEVRPPISVSKTPTNTPDPAGMTPNQIKNIYHLPKTGGKGTIAIIAPYNAPSVEQDLTLFSSTFGLPSCTIANGCLEIHSFATTTATENGGWGPEIAADVEWAHAIAPSSKILLVSAQDPMVPSIVQAVDYAANRSDVVSISLSLGVAEDANSLSYDSHFVSKYGAAFFAASGDTGNGVFWPASSPNVIGVGGTTFSFASGGALLGETAWSGSGGGISAYESEPNYQKQYAVPQSNGMRAVPDVAYYAGTSPNKAYVLVYNGAWNTFYGTSAGAPQWAAIATLGSGVKNSNFYADALLTASNYFNDITSGQNGTCGYYCTARTGYDYLTGLGSPRTTNF